MEIGKDENFNNLEQWIKKSIANDFMSYIDNGGFGYKKDLTEIANQFKHTTTCIKKITTLIKVEQEKNIHFENALKYQSQQIEYLYAEILKLKK